MRSHLMAVGRAAFLHFASPDSTVLAEMIIWALLGLIGVTLVLIPGDQSVEALAWLLQFGG